MARRKKKDEYNISDIIKGSTKAGVNHAKIGGNSKPKVTHVDLQKNIKQGAKNTQNHHVTRTNVRNSSSHYDRSVTGNTFRTNRGINRIGNATSGLTKDWLSGKMLTGSQMHSNVNAGRIRRENYNRYRDQRGSNDRRFVNTTSRQENRIKTDIVQNKNKIKSEIKSTQKAADIGSARTEKQAFSLQKSAQKDLNKSKKGAGKVGSFAIDAYTNAMEMGLDLLAGGGATAMPSLASRSYGTAYMQAINDQKNTNGSNVTKQMKSNAAKYALGESALQAGTEKMFAPFKPLTKMSGKGVFGSLGESIEKKTLNTNAVKGLISKGMSEKTAGRIVKGLVGTTEEGLEEVAADIPEPLLQSKTYDKDAKKQYKQGSYYAGMARDFALGAGTAALLGGANAAIEGGNKLAKSGNSFSKGTKNSILESAKKSSNEEVKTQLNAITSNKEATDKDYRNLANSMTLEEATKQPEDSEAYQRATQIQKQKSKGYKITDDDYSDLANKVYSSKKQISERQDNAIREATAQLAGDTSKMNRAAKVTTSDAPVVMNLTASAVNEESENAEAVLRSIMPDVDTANSPQLAELPDAIGRIQVGTATVQDYSTIMGSNEGKALFTAVSGQNLPATNSGAVNILTQYTARQRVMNSPQIIMQAKNIVKNNAMNAMTQGLTENESKAYMAGLDNLDTDQIDNYNEAFLKYFNGGFVKGRSGNKENGFSMDTISKNISPEIRKSIGEVNAKTFYEAGIKRGTEQTEKANKSSSKVKKTAETKSGTLKASNLSKRRLGEEAVSYIESIASITGTNIEIKETTKDSKNINGYFKGNDTIVLYDGADNPLGQVIKHELTHYIKKHAPKEYEAYQSFIIDNYYKYSPDALSKRVNGLISLYNQNGVKLTYEDALEELCADATDVFFKDSDMIDRICRENRTLAEKIYDGIKSLLTALKKLGQESKTNYGGFLKTVDALDDAERLWTKALAATADTEVFDNGNEVVQYSIRQEDPPKKTIKAYKVFVAKEGKLYPPMVANPEGADTPVGVWLNADVGKEVTPTKTGRRQVKAGGKGTQGGSGSLSYRPGWHLGAYPMAKQFARLNPKTGKKELFPENFVWAECEIAADKNYQNEAHENGMTKNGKFNHAYAGLQHIPEDGYYEYRTNPDPTTKPWYITGAMKVVKILDDAETNKILSSAGEPIQHRKGGSKTLKDLGLDDVQNKLSNKKKLSLSEQQYNIIKNSNPLSERFNENSDDIRYSISAKDSQGKKLSNAQREFFKDSKAVDKDGNLAVVYHGTAKGDFTTFDPKFSDDGISIFMSDNKGIALSYAGSSDPISESNKGRGIYSCYLNLKNPMTVDCRGANWNKILDPDYDSVLFEYKDTKDGKRNYLVSDNGGNGKLLSEDEIESKYGDKVSEELHHEELTNKSFKRMNKTITVYTKGGNVFYPKWNDDAPIMKTRDICKRAYDNGNDGVIFSNVYDTGKYSSGTSKSTIYAAFSPEQIKNTDNTKPTGSDDIRFSISDGYHAGDLGKAESYFQMMSGSRSTGHYGTGTYFVGDKIKVEGYNKRGDKLAPVEVVDFSKYNLFKPSNYKKGMALHEDLKKVNNLVGYYDYLKKTDLDKLRDDISDEFYNAYDNGKYNYSKMPKADAFIDRFLGSYTKNNIELKAEKYYNEYKNDPDREGMTEHDYYYNFMEEMIDKKLDEKRSSNLIDWQNDINELADRLSDDLSISKTKTESALEKTAKYDAKMSDEYSIYDSALMTADSPSTVFMKALGYEGIDVRDIDSLDNTAYGSVIYDLKGKDAQRKKKIGTAKYSISLNDSDNNKLTAAQREYFKSSKAVDEKGNLAVVYHGTNNGGFTVFNRTNNYYTDNASVADSYTKNNGIYKGYVNIKNPLVVDAKGNKFSGIPIENIDLDNIQKYAKEYGMSEFIENGKLRTSTADIVGLIEDLNDELNMGYDGVIFRNIYDEGLFGDNNNNKSNVYVTFNGNQFKNTTNINPTDNEDIRYSISEKDSTGETLTEDQRKYFAQSKAVDRQGNLEVLYHGTSEGGFTVFDPMMSDDETSLFFTDDEDVAATYSDSWDLYDSTEDNEGEAMNYPVYLNLKNPLIMNGNGYASWNNIAIKGFERLIFESEDGEDYSILSSNTGEEYDDKKTIERKFGKDTLKVIEEKNNGVLLLKDGKLVEDESMDAGNVSVYDGKMVAGTTRYWAKYAKEHGYDGVIFNNIADEGLYGDGITYRTSNIYIAFNSNQVKDVSNEHPTENEDIRYQFSNKAPGNNPALAVERKRNKRMEKEISRLKSEFKRSKNVTPDDKDTNKAISNLIETWKGKVSRKVHAEIKKDVVQIYRELNQQNPGWSAIEEFCCDAADLIINESEILKNSDAYSLRKDVIKDLRRIGTITVDPIHDHELGDGWNAMRKSFFGIVNLTHEKGHGSLDTQWQEWAGARPDIFPADATEGDQIKILDEILKSGKPDYRGIESAEFTDDELFDKVAEDVLRMSFGLKQHKTFADRKAEDKQAALEKQKKRMDDRYNKMVEKNRKNMADKDREYREKIKDVRSRYKDKKDRKYYTERIKSYANWMSGRLLQPTEGKYIPEGYRKAVARLLSSFDFETDRTTKNAEKNGLSKRMIHVIDLITQYQNIMDNDESMMQVSDDFQDKLNKLAVLENKRVADLTTEELADVYHVVKDIATHLSNMNKAFADGVKEQISELGDAVIAESRDTKDRSNASGIIPAGIDFITTSNNNPIDEFVCIGGTMEKLYMNIRKGFDKYIHNAEKIKEFTSTLQNEYKDIKNWSGDRAKAKTFKMQDGKTIQLTTAQVMSLYCLSKRPQALTHLMGSGIVSASVLNIKGKAGGRAFKSLYASRTSESRVMPTTMDINNILKGLTPDQIKVADYLQDYMVRVSAKLGNETSKKLYDIKKFNDPNYFPIKSSDKYLEEKFDNKQPSKIKNVGFTKETVKNASNPIVIDDIFNVFTNHTSTMAHYNALVPALTDFERVFNYKQRDKNGKTIASVRERLDAAYGRKTTEYITKFINDVNQNYNRDSDHELFNKVFANTKKGTLGFSLRVAIQQPTAIFRAGAVINPKYLMDVRNTAINLKEMREHSPIALWKSWGFYNTDVSSKMSDIFMNRRNPGDKLFMGIYGTLDDITWGYIWNATKAEIKQTRPELEKGSKAYWNAVNDRFSYIVDRTQVVDSVFHRSQIMRKTGMFWKLITAYMAEPTKTYNMLKTELTLASKDIKAGNKADATKRISRVTSVFFANAIAVSVAAALIDVLRSTLWDDDDNDDKDFLERWLKYSEQNTLQNINPLSFIPGLRDVQSIFQGYDANRADLEVIIQLKTAIDTWSSDTASTFKKIKVTAKAISLATGIPVSNIIREGESAYFEAVSAISGSPTKAKYMMHKLEYNYKSDTGESKLVKDYKTALKQGDTTAIKYIKKDLTDNVGVKPERLSNVVKNIYSDRLKAAIATYDADKVLKLIATEKAHGADTSKMLDTIVYKTTEDYKKTYDLENDDPKTRTKIDNFLRGIGYSKSYVKARKERYDRGWARYQVYMVYKHYGYNKAYAEAAYYCRKYPGIYKDARTMMYGQKRLGDSTKAGYLKGKWEAK